MSMSTQWNKLHQAVSTFGLQDPRICNHSEQSNKNMLDSCSSDRKLQSATILNSGYFSGLAREREVGSENMFLIISNLSRNRYHNWSWRIIKGFDIRNCDYRRTWYLGSVGDTIIHGLGQCDNKADYELLTTKPHGHQQSSARVVYIPLRDRPMRSANICSMLKRTYQEISWSCAQAHEITWVHVHEPHQWFCAHRPGP